MENPIHQSFWGVIVEPGKKITLDSPDDYYTVITGAVLADYDQSNVNNSSTLTGTVHTTIIDKIDPNDEFDPETIMKTNFAYLIPEKAEQAKMNHVFSPLSKIELEVSGPNAIHVSGKYLPVNLDGEEEEDISEFDDSDDDLNDAELKEKIMNKYLRTAKDNNTNDDEE